VIVHAEFVFPIANHEAPMCGAWQRPRSVRQWFGVIGTLNILGRLSHREISVGVTLSGFNTNGDLEAAVQLMANALDLGLTGTLVIDGVQYAKCVFLGWEPQDKPFYCGTGVNKWTQFGRLTWHQSA
jgi:hypothetical protein